MKVLAYSFCPTIDGFEPLHLERDKVTLVKNSPASAGGAGDVGSVPGSRRFLGGGNGNPLQYSGLENPRDRGAWWAIVHVITESQNN